VSEHCAETHRRSDQTEHTALLIGAGTSGTSPTTRCKESRSQFEAVAIHYRSQEAKIEIRAETALIFLPR
jgi:hypothetical protein